MSQWVLDIVAWVKYLIGAALMVCNRTKLKQPWVSLYFLCTYARKSTAYTCRYFLDDAGWLFPSSYFVRGDQEIPIYHVVILCYTKYELLAGGISHSVEVLLVSCCQRRGAEPQLSIGLIVIAMLQCCFLVASVHSLLKLQFGNKLDQTEKLWFFQTESENWREKKEQQKANKTKLQTCPSSSSARLSDWLMWLGCWVKMS